MKLLELLFKYIGYLYYRKLDTNLDPMILYETALIEHTFKNSERKFILSLRHTISFKIAT